MSSDNFLEVQTPILTASSPEGARDYLVPSRIHPGKFYALPQAPQQFKQLLMVSGFDRYFQIAPCFRDEDLRADRVPEFYQLDMELSFVNQDDVLSIVEPIAKDIFSQFAPEKVSKEPFRVISFEEAELKYGTDKPDLRNPIELCDASEVFDGSDFSIFAGNIKKGMVVRAIPAPGTGSQPRSFFDKMIAFAQENGAKGLGYIIFDDEGNAKGPIAKFLTQDRLDLLREKTGVKPGDSVFFSSDKTKEAARIAGIVRNKLGVDLDLIKDDGFKFCWIVDFPMYEMDEATGKIDFSHNPFSMPVGGVEALEGDDLLAVKANQYDLVCNGYELASGAIRNHKPDVMYRAFELVGYEKNVVDESFPALINAFKYGAPPHGGIAFGIDRILMLLTGEPNLREVTPFVMNGKAQDLMMGAPSNASLKQLRELHLKTTVKN